VSRREFSTAVKRDAAARANGKCEECGARLPYGGFHFDHVIPDGLGGEPTLDNCAVLCLPCHRAKTSKVDVPRIAKTKRNRDLAQGIRKPSRMAGAKNSPFKQKIGGGWVDRATGEPITKGH